jgi:VanZ family protein
MLPLRLARVWLLAGWAGVLTAVIASLWPGGVPMPVNVWDKVQHALGYFLLTLWFVGLYPREKYLRIAAACFALGLFIELLQGLSETRSMQLSDVVANTAGIAVAVLLGYLLVGGWALQVERLAGLAPRRG